MQFSIIIPIYNVEKYLDKCINSVLEQTVQDFEIILVDDGSPDNCPKMCDEWAKKDQRIKVVHKENGGLSSARNAGIKVAEGDYVVFLDSDDFIHEGLLEHCLEYIQKGKKVFYFSYAYCFNDGTLSYVKPFMVGEKKLNSEKERLSFFSDLVKNDYFSGVAVRGCYSLAFLRENNLYFNEKCLMSEDIMFNLQMMFYLEEYIEIGFCGYYYFLENQSSLTHTSPRRGNLEFYNEMSLDAYQNFQSRGFNYVCDNYGPIHFMLISCAQNWLKIGRVEDAKKYLTNHTVKTNSDFFMENMKKALKFKNKIKYNENRPQEYIRKKCYKILKQYSLDQNEKKLERRLQKLEKSLRFVRNKARILRRVKNLFKRK